MAAWLKGLTGEACSALKGATRVIEGFPFRVGRESRAPGAKPWVAVERRSGTAPQLNDLYLVEVGEIHDVSREHFQIELEEGRYFITDRGSTCGTIVDGRKVGGDRKGERVEIHDHDVIIVGTSTSRFVFQFRTSN
jgi:pSer/pThr/pTyr-binding forkhead associated (FHA) protein